MINVIIVDDEPLAQDVLETYIEKMPDLNLVQKCNNALEANEALKAHDIDLMFLDIQMPGINGFEVVKALQSDTMPMVVFATAFNQYAIDAFDLHAVDYILKPLDPERVKRAVMRAVERLQVQDIQGPKSPLIGAIDDIAGRLAVDSQAADSDGREVRELPEGMKRKLLIRDSGVIKVIPFDDIDWVDAAGDYMCVHALGETHIVRSTLRELMGRLDDKSFARIHRSTIVNIERVVTITPLQKGGSLLHLAEGQTLKVSRNYRESIRQLFK